MNDNLKNKIYEIIDFRLGGNYDVKMAVCADIIALIDMENDPEIKSEVCRTKNLSKTICDHNYRPNVDGDLQCTYCGRMKHDDYEKFNCYEIHRPNIPADGCKTQCEECKERDEQLNNKNEKDKI
jgi:hypothetical protein